MNVILLSVKPEYAEKILSGEKKYEFRKRVAGCDINRIILYSTSPIQSIVGEVEVKGTLTMCKTSLWKVTKMQAGISRQKYRQYFKNAKQANAYILGKAIRYNENVALSEFGLKQAPQSFVYLKVCPYCGNVLSENNRVYKMSTSKSEEHIIPLSLGNSKLIIPKGVICDSCNNYFSTNIEKQFLDMETIKLLRSCHTIPSRKNRIPDLDISINNEMTKFKFDPDGNCCFVGLSKDTIDKLKDGELESFFTRGIDIYSLKNNYIVSRFLVKIFTELCLFYTLEFYKKNSNNSIKTYEFDDTMTQLFNYVRRGDKQKRIYKYSVEQIEELRPFSNDDFVANISINFVPNTNQISGMSLILFEIRFDLYLSQCINT